jgi:hypothetical protein
MINVDICAEEVRRGLGLWNGMIETPMFIHSVTSIHPPFVSYSGNFRGGNRLGRVGFGFGSDGSGQFDFLEEIGSGRVESGRVRIGSDQFDFLKKSDRIGFESGRVGRICRVRSDSVTSKKSIVCTIPPFN